MTLEEKCEHLMNVVVESRKRFGKMCIEYEQKSSLMENKLLNLQLETISNYRFKSKSTLPNINAEDMVKNVDDFKVELLEAQKRIDDLQNRIKDTHKVVLQYKCDNIGKKLLKPLNAEAMLVAAKSKKMLTEKEE
ncbi:unnamed protein product, partial [Brenthis ino]